MQEKNRQRNSFVDMGIMVALSVCICMLMQCLLFGPSWLGVMWILMSAAYLLTVWRMNKMLRKKKVVTVVFLVFSALALGGAVMMDDNQRPVMHAYEGMGDTIADYADRQTEEVEMPVLLPDAAPADSAVVDTLAEAGESGETEGESAEGVKENLDEVEQQADSAMSE